MPVITIGRMYGAGGETVGGLVAERLGAELVDSKIFEEVAQRLELPHDEVEKHEEVPGSFMSRVLQALGTASIEFAAPPEATAWTPPYTDLTTDTRKAVLQITQEVIREAARTGNAVIVGRGGAYILRDEPRCLHVFLRGSERDRVAALRQSFGFSEEEARRRMKRVDANRRAYVRQVYNHDWLDASHYHLVLDTGRLGYERSAAAIVAAVR
ncbi:MAG TPA: cytidylate kinase-like family protein [Candidatus Dormibacteraeota bacterium]|nr:cytidylate kinase-like family protein [Candidatus Dormibacteraeota bacterium]